MEGLRERDASSRLVGDVQVPFNPPGLASLTVRFATHARVSTRVALAIGRGGAARGATILGGQPIGQSRKLLTPGGCAPAHGSLRAMPVPACALRSIQARRARSATCGKPALTVPTAVLAVELARAAVAV